MASPAAQGSGYGFCTNAHEKSQENNRQHQRGDECESVITFPGKDDQHQEHT
jgi:hypothetical protein